MADFLKLKFLEAKKVRDPDGAYDDRRRRGDGGVIDSLQSTKMMCIRSWTGWAMIVSCRTSKPSAD